MKILPRSTSGFSILEMILVVALIGILLILANSYVKGIRTKGNTVRCISNQREIVRAILQYAGEHDGWLPHYQDANNVTWGTSVAPYLGHVTNTGKVASAGYRILRCPEADSKVTTTIGVHYSQQKNKAPFAINIPPFPGSKKLASVSVGTVLTADIVNPAGHAWFLSPNEFALTLDRDGDGIKETRPGDPPSNWFVFRHEGNNVCSFPDGSVRIVTPRAWGLNEDRLWGP